LPPGSADADKFLFERGGESAKDKKWLEAREYYRNLVDNYPQSAYRPDAKLALGDTYLSQGGTENLLLAPYFQSVGYAAAWGVLIAGVAQVILVAVDAEMRGVGIRLRMPTLDANTRRFLKALGPAIVGAGGVQLALFADTLIASFLPTGALSALYYADRINQLPIGVVGIAVGTVLLPEMSRRLVPRVHRRSSRSHGSVVLPRRPGPAPRPGVGGEGGGRPPGPPPGGASGGAVMYNGGGKN